MSDVFLLGAGFSKAISNEMPITKELGRLVVGRYKYRDHIDPMILSMMEEDEGQGFEKALTFLTQDKPWLPESENLRHKALYLDLANVIRGVLQGDNERPDRLGHQSTSALVGSLDHILARQSFFSHHAQLRYFDRACRQLCLLAETIKADSYGPIVSDYPDAGGAKERVCSQRTQ
jgi:hypothetical protein